MYIKIVAPVLSIRKCHSKEDWLLLDAINFTPSSCTGRFLTMHKRRRKKLETRSLSRDHAMLDDIQHGQVQTILNRCGLWAFNAFTLENVTGGRALSVLCVHLFHWYGLLDYFQLDVVRVWKLFTLIEEGYHSSNPYHNSIHAADVTQAMHCFLQEKKIREHMTPLEVMAALIGAVAHDLDHPGVNQHFLISTSNHLAILYQNMSVLENHHWRSAVGCLLESGVAGQLTPYRNELELQIRDLILATDINRQQEFLNKFKAHLDDDNLDLSNITDRNFILQIALKCADISNPTRPWDISHKWSLKVCDEFFRQGEFERKLNLPVTSICDQQTTSVAKIQVGFFQYMVFPLFSEWHRFLKSSLSTQMMKILESNQKKWEQQEKLLTSTSIEQQQQQQEHLLQLQQQKQPIRRQSLAVPTLESTLGVRRHSVPVNILEQTIPSRTMHKQDSFCDQQISDNIIGSQSSVNSGHSHYSSLHDDNSEDINNERPLSAENLLPEPSIASMTTSTAASSRLTYVLQGNTSLPPRNLLTRQQTFPPPQPYVRMRYMSATAEMSTCTETVFEDTNSSYGSQEDISTSTTAITTTSTTTTTTNKYKQQYMIPSIAVLSPNNNCSHTIELPITTQTSTTNTNTTALTNKLTTGDLTMKLNEKENVDPQQTNLSRRRGSAPVTMSSQDENISLNGVSISQALRRGSVPISQVSHYVVIVQSESCNESNNGRCAKQSTTSDLQPPAYNEQRHMLTRHTSLNGNKSGRRKKLLKRRSSGGPETVCISDMLSSTMSSSEAWTACLLLKRPDNPDALLARRRGSLPIEVLTVGHQSVF